MPLCCCAGESLPYPEHDDERMATERYKWLTIEQASAAMSYKVEPC